MARQTPFSRLFLPPILFTCLQHTHTHCIAICIHISTFHSAINGGREVRLSGSCGVAFVCCCPFTLTLHTHTCPFDVRPLVAFKPNEFLPVILAVK
uniref:Putative secreted protein n=1 Tax=Anopheles marajoara TaxID=58244 RepID=A0A2M4C987_9DIPT